MSEKLNYVSVTWGSIEPIATKLAVYCMEQEYTPHAMYQNLKAILDFQNSLKKTAQKHEAQLQTQNKRFILNNLGAQRIGNKPHHDFQNQNPDSNTVFSPTVTITSPKPN